MKSYHHNHLKKALEQLPEYEPGQEVWDNISYLLSKKGASLQFQKLPVYEAPESIWNNISTKLDQARPRLISIRKLYWYAAITAGVILGGFVISNQLSDSSSETISFSTEAINDITNASDWANDEAAFSLLDEFCNKIAFECNSPEFISLKTELDELNTAHSELKAVLTAFNEDPDLLEQLTLIERQRTDLLKTLFAKI